VQPWYLQLYPKCDAVAVHVAESANTVAVLAVHVAESANTVAVPIAVDSVDASHIAVVAPAIVAAAMLLGSAILLAAAMLLGSAILLAAAVYDVPDHGATVHAAAAAAARSIPAGHARLGGRLLQSLWMKSCCLSLWMKSCCLSLLLLLLLLLSALSTSKALCGQESLLARCS